MKEVVTCQITVYVGLREGYTNIVHELSEVEDICQQYCTKIGLCVTVTPTSYIYSHGKEPGAIIGFIDYPRPSAHKKDILHHALLLADQLKDDLNQLKVSVIWGPKTFIIQE